MPTPIEQTVWDAVAARLATITTGNGYNYTVLAVDENRDDYDDLLASELPRLNMVDGGTLPVDEEAQLPSMEMHRLTVRVEGFVAFGSYAATGDALRSLVADVRACLVSGYSWETGAAWGGGVVQSVRVLSAERAVARASRITGAAVVTIAVDYITNLFDPYTGA